MIGQKYSKNIQSREVAAANNMQMMPYALVGFKVE